MMVKAVNKIIIARLEKEQGLMKFLERVSQRQIYPWPIQRILTQYGKGPEQEKLRVIVSFITKMPLAASHGIIIKEPLTYPI